MTAAVFVLFASIAALQVEGDTRCPTPAEVEARLGTTEAGSARRARLTEDAGRLTVSLIDAGGDALATRTLPPAPCAALAEAAAVILRTWTAQLPTVAPTAPALPPPASMRWAVELGLLGATSEPYGGASFGGAARTVVSFAAPLELLAELAWMSPRRIALPGGAVWFQRASPLASVGARWVVPLSPVTLSLELSGGVARVAIGGIDLVDARQSAALDVGGAIGLQAHLSAGPVQPFLATRVVLWATRHEAVIGGLGERRLPGSEWLFSAGIRIPLGSEGR